MKVDERLEDRLRTERFGRKWIRLQNLISWFEKPSLTFLLQLFLQQRWRIIKQFNLTSSVNPNDCGFFIVRHSFMQSLNCVVCAMFCTYLITLSALLLHMYFAEFTHCPDKYQHNNLTVNLSEATRWCYRLPRFTKYWILDLIYIIKLHNVLFPWKQIGKWFTSSKWNDDRSTR